jgi:hypothetical protein
MRQRLPLSLSVAALGIIGLILAPAAWCGAAPKHDKPISRRFDIGGRSLYLKCTGSGRPTVVMDAGMANAHDAWNAVAPAISKRTRTCTYDRAGEGLSDTAPCVNPQVPCRTSHAIVSDLRRLLARAEVAPPYLLVGHSFGGLNMRLFAGEHPHDVVGLVLLDATPTTYLDGACKISAVMCIYYRSAWASNPENVQFERSAHQVDATKLPRVPLVVLTATNHQGDDPGSPSQDRLLEAQWQQAQKLLAASVPGGRLEALKGGHDIQDEHPQDVIAAISAILKTAG